MPNLMSYDRSAMPTRRLVAVGIIRRTNGRIVRITATPAGIAGSSRPAVAR